MKAGSDVIIVSSGAIAAGIEPLGLTKRPTDLATKQAAASVGQVALVERVEQRIRPLSAQRRSGAADRARHLDAGAAHQRPAHAGPVAGTACGGDRQRERHGGHQRDPVRRQRPALGAGGAPGRRRRAGAAQRYRRPLRLGSAQVRRNTFHRRGFRAGGSGRRDRGAEQPPGHRRHGVQGVVGAAGRRRRRARAAGRRRQCRSGAGGRFGGHGVRRAAQPHVGASVLGAIRRRVRRCADPRRGRGECRSGSTPFAAARGNHRAVRAFSRR